MPTPSDRPAMQLDLHIMDFLQALEARGGPPLWTLSPASAREVLLGLQRSVPVAELPVDTADCTLLGDPTGRIGLRIVRPQGASRALPGVMYVSIPRDDKEQTMPIPSDHCHMHLDPHTLDFLKVLEAQGEPPF